MIKLLCVFVVVLMGSGVQSQVMLFGKCPNTTVVKNFKVQKYLGRWFEIKKYFAVFQIGTRCTEANYSLLPCGNVAVVNKARFLTGPVSTSIEGTANIPTPGEGKLNVVFTGMPNMTTSNYHVLGTDYDNFAVVFSCRETRGLIPMHREYAWILSRTRSLSSDSDKKIADILSSNGVSNSFFLKTNQKDCP